MYEDKTPEAIKAQVVGEIAGDWDTREGSFADDILGPAAVEINKVYSSLNAVQDIVWVNENSGPFLDLAAEDIGVVPRKAGTRATVILLLTGVSGYTVPAGTTFATADGIFFDTTKDAVIGSDETITVEAMARDVGEKCNVPENTIIYQFSNSANISTVTNPEAAKGGADVETDKSLYARIAFARQRPATSGNKYHYEQWALETPGVGTAKVYPLWAGNGTVKVLIASDDRQPVDEVIVASCAAHIEKVRPIGATVTVESAAALVIDVAVMAEENGAPNRESIQAAFSQVVTEHFAAIALLQREVTLNRIGAILMGIDGVEDYAELMLNGQEQNVALAYNEVPLLGEVTITWT